jgi:hypothetical protein
MTDPSGFHRPDNPFTAPCPVIIRNTALALLAQAAKLERQRQEKKETSE